MARRIAHQGTKFSIAFAQQRSGACPGGEFFDGLDKPDQAKVMALFLLAGEGKFSNPEKFGNLGDGLYEFKSFKIRMPYAHSGSERGVIVVTHGFIKKSNKAPKEEIARARRIYEEDQKPSGLKVVPKKKQ